MGIVIYCFVLGVLGVFGHADSKQLTLIQILKLADADGIDTGDVDIPKILGELTSTLNDTSESYDDLDLGEIDPSELVKSCSHGKCDFCTKGKWFHACVIAELLPKEIGFRVALTINDHTIFEKKVSVAKPPPFCINVVPGLKLIADLCLEIYDVNLKEKSACARISFKLKLFHKKINMKIACFKLPFKENDLQITDESMEWANNEQASTIGAVTTGLDLSPSYLELTEADFEDLVKSCSKGRCEYCVKKHFKACLVVEVLSSKIGFEIILTFDGKQIMKQEITVADPKPFCISKPVPGVTDLCLSLENINLKELSACAKVSATVKIGPLKPKKYEFKQCFKIPTVAESMEWASNEQASNIGAVTTGLDLSPSYLELTEADFEDLVKSCSKGRCEYCVKKQFKACLVVEVLSSKIGFEIILTFDGKQIMKQEITVADPKPFCISKPVPGVTDLCLSLENINLKGLSACAKVSATVKIGPLKPKKYEFKQCFKIPTVAESMEWASNEQASNIGAVTTGLDLSPSYLELTEADFEDLVKSCSKGRCEYCVKKQFKACLVVEVLSSKIGFEIILTFDGKQIMKQEITVADPKPFCISKPVPGVTDLCLSLENINLKELSACAKVSATVKIGPLKPKKYEFKQCFKIPTVAENSLVLGAEKDQGSVLDLVSTNDLELLTSGLYLSATDLEELLTPCSKGMCKFCMDKPFKGCMQLDVLSDKIGFDVILTYEGKQVMKQEITVPDPKPFCMSKTPVSQITDLCLTVDKINLKDLKACAKVSCKATIKPLPPKKFEAQQCFQIPKATDADRMIAEEFFIATEAEEYRSDAGNEAETYTAQKAVDILKFVPNRVV